MGLDAREALARLEEAAAEGVLDELGRRQGLRLLVAFGSAVRTGEQPRDLDIAVAFERGTDGDVLAVLADLVDLTRADRIDIMNLDAAGPVAREQALVACLPLFESDRGAFARAQMAAILERMETAWLRRLDLELLSEE